jgi:amino acid permease
MDHRNFAFNKTNFILLAIGMAIVIIGFVLMAGSGSDEQHFAPEIFSATRIKTAPMVCLFGFLFMIGAIMYRPKNSSDNKKDNSK